MDSNNLSFLPSPPWLLRVEGSVSEVTLATWQTLQSKPTFVIRILRGTHMETFKDFFHEIGAAMQFPYYFGENFNAVRECLADLEWLPGKGYLLVVTNADRILHAETQDDQAAVLRLFDDAAEEWSKPVTLGTEWDRDSRPFHVVLHCETASSLELLRIIAVSGKTVLPLSLSRFKETRS
jgi:RNAse (barnase) inhibitor barstar